MRLQLFFKFVSKLNFILLASALLYSTSFNSHQFSWLGASYVSVLQRACIWVNKQANFSQKIIMTSAPTSTTAPPLQSSLRHHLLPGSRLRRGRAAVLLFPVLPCISIACYFSWRSHSQSTKLFSGGPMPSRLKFYWRTHAQSTKVCPGGHMPSRLKFFLCTTHVLSCITLVHHSHALLSCTTLVHLSCTHVLSCTTSVISFTTLVHYSHAPLARTTHVLSCTTQQVIISTVNILKILIVE